jgi:nitric oxide reductase NorQ protein
VNDEELTVLALKPKPDFVETPCIRHLAGRALSYLQAGFPVHFSGPAGTGKTTLAMHVAAQLGRPVVLIHGDDEPGSSHPIDGPLGYRSARAADNGILAAMKTEENVARTWVDHRLSNACKFGFTVIYDEFSRSRPESNNVLRSVVEERLLEMPAGRVNEGHLSVHPAFSAIFTSNPEEYAGVHKTQDALMDRMITITVGPFDRETEAGITAAKSGLDPLDAEKIVDVVGDFRTLGMHHLLPTIRACIMIAKVTARRGAAVSCDDPVFYQTCRDVLRIDSLKITRDSASVGTDWLDEILARNCPPSDLPLTTFQGLGSGNGTGGHLRGERDLWAAVL